MNKQLLCFLVLITVSAAISSNLLPLYRHFNSQVNDNFYTTDRAESDQFRNQMYAFEAVEVLILEHPVKGAKSLIRLFHPSKHDHFYTTSVTEKNLFISNGYLFEGIEGYLLSFKAQDSVPLYRAYHPTSFNHFYTTTKAEFDAHLADGYLDEGITGYGFANTTVVPSYIPVQSVSQVTELFRMFNVELNDHFYTNRITTRNYFLKRGYKSEASQGFIVSEWVEGTQPLFRAFNPDLNDHFYTNDATELFQFQEDKGYDYEGIEGYTFVEQGEDQQALYRLYNENVHDHFLTNNQVERINYQSSQKNYVLEQITGYSYNCRDSAQKFLNQFDQSFVNIIPLYRNYNPDSHDHMYTISQSESNSLQQNGYNFEGIECYVLQFPLHSSQSFNRLFNEDNNDHFYTNDEQEKRQFLAAGYEFESVQGFVNTLQVESSIPLHRLFNGDLNDHFYTIDEAEKTEFIAAGYTYEGIEGYVFDFGGTYSGNDEKPEVATVYRLYSSQVNDHFYTTDQAEAQYFQEIGYQNEGLLGYLSQTWIQQTRPVYRLFNIDYNDHFYTTDTNELMSFLNTYQYFFESIEGYIFQTDDKENKQVFRLYHPINHDHFYTTSVSEKLEYQKKGYVSEKSPGYIHSSVQNAQNVIGTQDHSLSSLLPIYRNFNPSLNDHFYTNDFQEHEQVESYGYAKEESSDFLLTTPVEGSLPLIRLFNPTINDHFYTSNQTEANEFLATEVGYKYEGILGFVLVEQEERTVALYRMYNSVTHDHFYTVDIEEKTEFEANGYVTEGIPGYVFLNSGSFKQEYHNANAVPLYRMFHPDRHDHFYTSELDEMTAMYGEGYLSEGIAGYVSDNYFPSGTPIFGAFNPQINDHFYTVNSQELTTFLNKYGYLYIGIQGYIATEQYGTAQAFQRFYNPLIKDHFYSAFEAEQLLQGYNSEGFLGYIFSNKDSAQNYYQKADRFEVELIAVHRLYNPENHDHFYTVYESEIATFEAIGYNYEQIQCFVLKDPTTDSLSLKRLYNGDLQDHFYTSANHEKAKYLSLDYSYEGILGYVLPYEAPGSVKLYRLFNQVINDHFYTISEAEVAVAVESGYDVEENSGYVFPGPGTFAPSQRNPDTVELYRVYNDEKHDHFYTIREDELLHKQQTGYAFQQPSGFCSNFWVPGSQPVYRSYSTTRGDHFYTTDGEILKFFSELNNGAYDFEEVTCYIFRNQLSETVLLTQTFNPELNDHFYTTNANELLIPGYDVEDDLGYIFSNSKVAVAYISGFQSKSQYQAFRTQPLYRFYNPIAHDHYYTTDDRTDMLNYDYEGIQCYVLAEPLANTVGFTQVYNSRTVDHTYLTNIPEIQEFLSNGYKFVANSGFILTFQDDGFSSPLYALYHPELNDHFYTSNLDEFNEYKTNGYQDQGISGYVLNYDQHYYQKVQASTYSVIQRLYHPTSFDHAYVTSDHEREVFIAKGYVSEGIAGFGSLSLTPQTNELYRTFNPISNDHFYTASFNELITFLNTKGYFFEGVESYVYKTKIAGSTPLYRLFNAKIVDHFYTASDKERTRYLGNGYKSEGITGYVFVNQKAADKVTSSC